MTNLWRRTSAGVASLLLLSLTACLGGSGHRASSATAGAFPLQVSPGSLSIPAGGGGFLAVSTVRFLPHDTADQGDLTLTLEAPPAGITGSGRIPANGTTGTLSLWIDPSVPPQTLPLRVRAAGTGSEAAVATFELTVAPPLPPGQLRADGAQAPGGLQQAGALANVPVVQEPVAATTAADASRVQVVRHGFDPDGATH